MNSNKEVTANYQINTYELTLNATGNGEVSKVTDKEEHVTTVMLTGFFHAYGPINNYFS